MISFEQHMYAVNMYIKNRTLHTEFGKMYGTYENTFELCCYYVEKKKIGILFFHYSGENFAAKISKSPMSADSSGRVKPVICDLCYTRMPGSEIAKVTFDRMTDNHTFTWLICNDFSCSLNVRELTAASKDSKKILGENVSVDKKITRLEKHILRTISALDLQPLKGALYAN